MARSSAQMTGELLALHRIQQLPGLGRVELLHRFAIRARAEAAARHRSRGRLGISLEPGHVLVALTVVAVP